MTASLPLPQQGPADAVDAKQADIAREAQEALSGHWSGEGNAHDARLQLLE